MIAALIVAIATPIGAVLALAVLMALLARGGLLTVTLRRPAPRKPPQDQP